MKINLASVLKQLSLKGWVPGLEHEVYERISSLGLRAKSLGLAAVATEIAFREQPVTLRGLFYRVVSAGWLPSTDRKHYDSLGRLVTKLREAGIISFSWIVDNLRATLKPSSWPGLADYSVTVERSYRKDFWQWLPNYVHIICEKDAIAGIVEPLTNEFNVALSPVRGYCSITFAHEIARQWRQLTKPIHAYYLGDFDPSGFDLERDLKSKLERYCPRPFDWKRLAIIPEDFAAFGLLPLKAKVRDCRYTRFIATHGPQCAELDALPATELRRRVREAIEDHIEGAEWEQLREIERQEKEDFSKIMCQVRNAA